MTAKSREGIEIRKIENGFIVRRETFDYSGGYKCTEVYSPTRPTIETKGSKPKAREPAASSLSTAIKGLK